MAIYFDTDGRDDYFDTLKEDRDTVPKRKYRFMNGSQKKETYAMSESMARLRLGISTDWHFVNRKTFKKQT